MHDWKLYLLIFTQAISQPLNNIVQIVLENASEPFDVSEVVTVQNELLAPQILSLAKTKSSFQVWVNSYMFYVTLSRILHNVSNTINENVIL